MSLRTQINLRIALASLLILLLGGAVTVWQARESVNKEITSSLNLAAQLIRLNFHESASGTVDAQAWLPRFVSLEQTRHLQILLQQANGDTVKFTAHPMPEPAALPPLWFSELVANTYPSVQQTLATVDGGTVSLRIEADPADEISEAWQESQAFFIALGVLAALTFLAVNLAFNRAFKAITEIVTGLGALERGDYQHKLPDFETREFDQIAKAINHLTAVLAATAQENGALARHTLQIQEEERRHLSQELHDELGQSLTAVKVLAVTLTKPQADVAHIANTISQVCDHLITVVRSMMRHLHPLALGELGLKATLEDLCNQWAARHPQLALTLVCPDAVDALSPDLAIHIYRIVQECITNIVRHAEASAATVTLAIKDGVLTLTVVDNGLGCPDLTVVGGFGLLGMRERVKNLSGQFGVHTSPPKGCTVHANIPVPDYDFGD